MESSSASGLMERKLEIAHQALLRTQGLQLDTGCWAGYHPEIKLTGKGGSAT